ncbi:hypothetical protein NKH54_22540 [Mesorhizobium sp. M1004]|uniref:hypothetical protein n=1 Tax=Mesorhizobium sp. M1004 TaxID=2957046 RepID=UPI00333BE13D
MIGSLAAYYFVAAWMRGDFVEIPEVYKVAKCQRAVIEARKGHPDPELLAECRRAGLIPPEAPAQGN